MAAAKAQCKVNLYGMEADGGWGVMDDLLSQRTALCNAWISALQQPAPRYRRERVERERRRMGLFLAPANKNKPKKALRTLGTIPPTGNDDDDARWRQIGLVDPELSRILWVSLLTNYY